MRIERQFVLWLTAMAFFCACIPGCTSWRVVSLIEADLERESLPGKHVRITAPPEDPIMMTVDKLNYPYILGTPDAGEQFITVNLLLVNRMEVEEFSVWRTSVVVISSVAGAAMMTLAAALAFYIGV